MIVLRLVAVLSLLAIVISLALFVYTRNRDYLVWAKRTFQIMLILLVVVMVLFVLERLVLV